MRHAKTLFGMLVATAIIAAVIFLNLFRSEYIEGIDKKVFDATYHIRGPLPHSGQIVIVNIDEKSLREVGQWPWPRQHVARVIENLTAAGAGIIGFDMLFAEADNSSPATVARDYNHTWPNAPDHDAILADTIAQTPTIISYAFDFDPNRHTDRLPVSRGIYIEKGQPTYDYLPNAHAYRGNLERIDRAAYSSGFFNTFQDSDGVIRSVPLFVRYHDAIYPSLAFEITRLVLGANKTEIHYGEYGVESVTVGRTHIPTDRHGRLLISFRGRAGTYPYISASDVLFNRMDPNAIAGRVVLIGTTAIGLNDIRSTPVDSTFPGVEVHANAIDNLLNDGALTRPAWSEGMEMLLIIIPTLATALALLLFRPLLALLSLMLAVSAMLIIFYRLILVNGYVISVLYPFLSLFITAMVIVIIDFLYESRQKERVKRTFAKKVSPEVADALLKQRDTIDLQGSEQNVTVFFSDIRNFTTLTEAMQTPQAVVEWLNAYFKPMSDTIMARYGTIDKFIGDAIMAYWNAPNRVEQHQDQAVRCALEQLFALELLNSRFDTIALPPIGIGIGIHTGDVILGEMGSSGRSDYTVIGDTVNLASRLEGMNKFYGSTIIISDATLRGLNEPYVTRPLDRVAVKGKKTAVLIHEVLPQQSLNERAAKELILYNAAFASYSQGAFQEALRDFETLEAANSQVLYRLYVDRCRHLLNDPPEHFDGIYRSKEK